MGKKKIPIKTDLKDFPDLRLENPEKFYEFGVEIGRGKFAVVKEAIKKDTKVKYAAKIIKFDSETEKFAVREYDLMWKDKHTLKNAKGTVQLHEAFIVRKYLIIIMDFVNGKTLLDKVSHMMTITEDDVAHFIRQLCEYLEDWHSKNIIHLDLRPTNIRFDVGRELKIVDYNSCRHIANKKVGEVVDVIGDTEFCAPELLNFDRISPGTDTWTIGVLTYILLSGISPFYDEDEKKVVSSVQTVKWEFVDEMANVTSEAKLFIKAMLVKIPENRMKASEALNHKWLSKEYEPNRKNSVLQIQDNLNKTDERLMGEEEEEYIEASLVFRTFDEDEYASPEEEESDSDKE